MPIGNASSAGRTQDAKSWGPLVSLVSNLVFGNLSDRTRSRFGKRSPWVVCGGVLGGLSLFAIGVLANSAVITVVYCVCMVGLNMMLAPAIAVLSDRVPESIRLFIKIHRIDRAHYDTEPAQKRLYSKN